MTKKTKSNGAKERISVSFGDALHDLGMVADLPKAVLWFYLCWLLNSSTRIPASDWPISPKQAIMLVDPNTLLEWTPV